MEGGVEWSARIQLWSPENWGLTRYNLERFEHLFGNLIWPRVKVYTSWLKYGAHLSQRVNPQINRICKHHLQGNLEGQRYRRAPSITHHKHITPHLHEEDLC